MLNKLIPFLQKPKLYKESTTPFWNDEYISKQMLEAHLNPKQDGATRNHEFVDKSVNWIASILSPDEYSNLLDLGCGPGIYAEKFYKKSYNVTGVDFSKRSIKYAKEQALINKSDIQYIYQNYLEIDYSKQFDVVTLIYCDYAVLSIEDRQILLKKIYKALKPNGKFIFDVFTLKMKKDESQTWHYYNNNGFFSPKPHLCLETIYQYENNTELRQSIIVTDEEINCYNIWDHFFTQEMLISEITAAGFNSFELFGDIAGGIYSQGCNSICAVVKK